MQDDGGILNGPPRRKLPRAKSLRLPRPSIGSMASDKEGISKRRSPLLGPKMIRERLSEDRMNKVSVLPAWSGLDHERRISFSEVGDPNGFVVFLILGMDSHRHLSIFFNDVARTKGIRLLCLDRPGRGLTSDFAVDGTNRILAFPDVVKAFCEVEGIQAFSLLGQSLGATYALRIAQVMPNFVATTVYLVSPWVSLTTPGTNAMLGVAEGLPGWLIRGAMNVGTTMPKVLARMGAVGMMAHGCSEEEAKVFRSKDTVDILAQIHQLDEAQHGVVHDALTALEKDKPFGFNYQDVSMPVHVFHGRSDHMVPFVAAQWMGEVMPACTVSVKIGGTHSLIFDMDVLDCVMGYMAEDYRVFASAGTMEGLTQGQRVSFPVHTQHYEMSGDLLMRRGLPFRRWGKRHFILSGFQLHEFANSEDGEANYSVDLRMCMACTTDLSVVDSKGIKMYPFQVEQPQKGILYILAASSTKDRDDWVEMITKASMFRVRDRQEDFGLTRRYLNSSRHTSRAKFILRGRGGKRSSLIVENPVGEERTRGLWTSWIWPNREVDGQPNSTFNSSE